MAQRTWDRPSDPGAPSTTDTNASDGMQGRDDRCSPEDRLHRKVAMAHRADSTGGAVTMADQVEAPPRQSTPLTCLICLSYILVNSSQCLFETLQLLLTEYGMLGRQVEGRMFVKPEPDWRTGN